MFKMICLRIISSRSLRCISTSATGLNPKGKTPKSVPSIGHRGEKGFVSSRSRSAKKPTSPKLSQLFVPIPVNPNEDASDTTGQELSGQLQKQDTLKVLNQFFRRPEIKLMCAENGLDGPLFHQAFISFRRFVLESKSLPVDLHIILSDIINGAGHVDDLYGYFMKHATTMFPQLNCMEDLAKISDLRSPATWYPHARAIVRKIIFHAGPTNSGKTHNATVRFREARSGVYCCPLKLLASEIYHRAKEEGISCDLITGEERKYGDPSGRPSPHLACTVEMAAVDEKYEVAIIDEIQMLRDPQRGWAWTRALLGIAAEEMHLCGEEAALELVRNILTTTGEDVEVRRYERLTKLNIEEQPLRTFANVAPGDAFVCFNKADIFSVSKLIEDKGKEVAVIYGGLPPGTKLAQAKKFNDPDHPCKILVATDAIGMGLNLSIRRIIFFSLTKYHFSSRGEKQRVMISTSQALQIGGRAGRYGTAFSTGSVTTFYQEDLPNLKALLGSDPEPIYKAGLHPTADQIEMYSFLLPKAPLSNLVDIFINMCTVDASLYFMCNMDDFKFLADMIQHVNLPLRTRYVFCCAPINRRMTLVCSLFVRFAKQYSLNNLITFDWVTEQIGWPLDSPKSLAELAHLEHVFDVLDLYLWLSYRFADLFPDSALIREAQQELDKIIQNGIKEVMRLTKDQADHNFMPSEDEDDVEVKEEAKASSSEEKFTENGGKKF